MGRRRILQDTGMPYRSAVPEPKYSRVAEEIQRFIRKEVEGARAKGIVVGLSGGVDSSLAAYLAVNSLGNEGVLGLIMPDSRVTPPSDVEDARLIASSLGMRSHEIDISPILSAFVRVLPRNKRAEGNLRARIRMCLLYYHANLEERLVLGTGDRSEALIGYFTKYGDGGVDLLPIAGLYKSQVRALAKYLGVPERIYSKKSSPWLWREHEAEKEIGLEYDTIDAILRLLFDEKLQPHIVRKRLGVAGAEVRRIIEMNKLSEHKRKLPPAPRISLPPA